MSTIPSKFFFFFPGSVSKSFAEWWSHPVVPPSYASGKMKVEVGIPYPVILLVTMETSWGNISRRGRTKIWQVNRIPRSESEFLSIFGRFPPLKSPSLSRWISNQRVLSLNKVLRNSPCVTTTPRHLHFAHCAEPRKALKDGQKVGWGMFWEALSCWRLGAGEVGSG